MRTCPCGSGLERAALLDAAGIFCCYVCDDCKAARTALFEPSIFTPGTAYAASGEERDIAANDDGITYP